MTITNTLVILKPDALKRHLVGDIINRFEKRGLTINTLKHTMLTRDVLDQHYAHIKDKPFYLNHLSSRYFNAEMKDD